MSLLNQHLSTFLAVTEHKTVHKTAKEIHLTQTGVTQRIRALERQLKTTLFVRTHKGMVLTLEGEALLRYCQSIKELEGETLAIIQGAGKKSAIEIKISAPTSLMRSRVIPSCIPVTKEFPNLLINFNVDDIEKLHIQLRSGETDIAIIDEENLAEEMQFKKLTPEKYVLVCSPKWKKRKLEDIIKNERIIDFDSRDHVTFNYLKKYHLFDLIKHGRYFVNRTDSLALLASEGVGYTTLDKDFAMPYVKNKQLIILNDGMTHELHPILAWYNRPEPPAYFSAIIEAIK